MAQQDASFQVFVLQFLQHNAPAAMSSASRGILENIVAAYFNTSQNVHMARLLIDLHTRYNINGIAGAATLLAEAQATVNEIQNAPAAATPYTPARHPSMGSFNGPLTGNANSPAVSPASPLGQQRDSPISPLNNQSGRSQYPSSLLSERTFRSTFPPLTCNNPPGAVGYPPLSFNNPPGAMGYPPLSSNNAPGQMQNQNPPVLSSNNLPGALLRCFPPGLLQVRPRHTNIDRDNAWYYRCDRCGHPDHSRSELNRHGKEIGRAGFKVVNSNANTLTWYASDAAGNEYTGVMVRASDLSEGNHPIQDPCALLKKQYEEQYNAGTKKGKGARKDEDEED